MNAICQHTKLTTPVSCSSLRSIPCPLNCQGPTSGSDRPTAWPSSLHQLYDPLTGLYHLPSTIWQERGRRWRQGSPPSLERRWGKIRATSLQLPNTSFLKIYIPFFRSYQLNGDKGSRELSAFVWRRRYIPEDCLSQLMFLFLSLRDWSFSPLLILQEP